MKLFKALNEEIIQCTLCRRLVTYRENAPIKEAYKDQVYWRKPLPGFGDLKAELLILGLAPSPQGGNRTGRIFTGDNSAKFLIGCLYETGFANQPFSESAKDGLILHNCYMTAAVKCVPPKHLPTKEETLNCSRYFFQEMSLLKNLKAILALGQFAFDAFLLYLKSQGVDTKGMRFKHGAKFSIHNSLSLYCSYHPSPQNTNTGKLTKDMFIQLLKAI